VVSFKPVVIEDAMRAAGVPGDPAEVAGKLRAAGVPVSRDSRARWTADHRDPLVSAWLAGLARHVRAAPVRAGGVRPDSDYYDDGRVARG
jgi:hypothetical protein